MAITKDEILNIDVKLKNYIFDYTIITDCYSVSLRFLHKDFKEIEKKKKKLMKEGRKKINLNDIQKDEIKKKLFQSFSCSAAALFFLLAASLFPSACATAAYPIPPASDSATPARFFELKTTSPKSTRPAAVVAASLS